MCAISIFVAALLLQQGSASGKNDIAGALGSIYLQSGGAKGKERSFQQPTATITSENVLATFDSRGLVQVNVTGAPGLAVTMDSFALTVNIEGGGRVALNSSGIAATTVQQVDAETVVFVFVGWSVGWGPFTVNVTYEAHGAWRFLRKTLTVASVDPKSALVVTLVAPFDVLDVTAPSALTSVVYPTGDMGTYGAFSRWADGSGIMLAGTNPFLSPTIAPAGGPTGARLHVSYAPGITWNQTTVLDSTPQPFVADAGLLALYTLSANVVPPAIETDTCSSRYRATKPYASTLSPLPGSVTHATDTMAGMLFEHVSFSPAVPHQYASYVNYAERDAFRALSEAHFQLPPDKGISVHIPWTENDYQIDISNATQWAQYVRILTTLSRMGVGYILFAASNSDVSSYANCTDDWCWEPVLDLGMGEQMRTGAWVPGADAIPPSVQQLIDVSSALGVSAIPYVYPILGYTDGLPSTTPPDWLYPSGQGGGRFYASLANREFQDYFIGLTCNFSRATGAWGAGYDYTFFSDPKATAYAQWNGWRRILSTVRARMSGGGQPYYAVDNRQASHTWSPWMWAAGSYAEPLQSDEQTTSWTAYTRDPHIDRTDGNRQREMNYDYAQSKFCQPSAMPGFLSHNTDRCGGPGGCPRSDWNVRDYDLYGTPYSLLSAVATGGVNIVLNLIPSRDEGEFTAFPMTTASNTTASIDFYRQWLRFASENRPLLLHTQFLPVPPQNGLIDGTYAVANNSGYVFLFNPTSQGMSTPPSLLVFDGPNLGLVCTPGVEVFAVSEIWPVDAPAYTTVACGSNFTVAVEGRNALVLSIAPLAAPSTVMLLGRAARRTSTASLSRDGSTLRVEGLLDAAVPAGQRACDAGAALYALVPVSSAERLTRVEGADGAAMEHSWVTVAVDAQEASPCVPRPRAFAPAPAVPAGHVLLALHPLPPVAGTTFVHSQAVTGMGYNASFTGGTLTGTVLVPAAVFDQLAARAASYPVPWTTDDLAIAWLNPSRLIAYVDSNGAIPSGTVIPAWFDGTPVPINPVWSCRTSREDSCFQGYWLDLSAAGARADTAHNLTLLLPPLGPSNGAPRAGWDLRNGDLPGMPVTLNASDPNLCWALCNATAACTAWAYGIPGSGCEDAPHCWLKAETESWSPDACRVSGIQRGGGGAHLLGVVYDNVDTVYA